MIELSTNPPTAPQTLYTKSMNKTKMTHEELIAMVMADYTAKVIAEEKRRQEIREAVANGTYVPCPVQSDNWYISDRH